MGIEPVPNDQQWRADLAADIAQGLDYTAARDGGAEMTGIQPPIRCDRHHARHLASLAHPLEHWGDPAPRPGHPRPDPKAVAGLVPEDEGPMLPTGLFSRPPIAASARLRSRAHRAP